MNLGLGGNIHPVHSSVWLSTWLSVHPHSLLDLELSVAKFLPMEHVEVMCITFKSEPYKALCIPLPWLCTGGWNPDVMVIQLDHITNDNGDHVDSDGGATRWRGLDPWMTMLSSQPELFISRLLNMRTNVCFLSHCILGFLYYINFILKKILTWGYVYCF